MVNRNIEKISKQNTKQSNKKRPKLSIITTFYNAESYIYTTLSSINQQKHGGYDWEYVIVDDKSTDSSRKIVEDFINNEVHNIAKKNWRIIEPKENLGCGGARKYGIEHSTGDYLMFLDADDYYMNTDFCKRAMEKIISSGSDIVEYGLVYNSVDGAKSHSCVPQEVVIDNNKEAALLALYRDNAIKFNVWTKIYTRDIVNSYPYSETRLFEDVRTIPVWVRNANKVTIIPSCEVNYRAAAGSIVREDDIKTRVGTITAITELFPEFKEWISVLKAMYQRSMIDLSLLLDERTSRDPGFNEMARLNKIQLSYIFPDNYDKFTKTIDDLEDYNEVVVDKSKFKCNNNDGPTPKE